MGLLDFVGTDWEDPRTAATLQFAQGLLGGGRRAPVQGLAQGLLGYTQSLGASKNEALKQKFTQSQIDENASQNKQRDQMIELERQRLLRQQQQDALLRSLFPGQVPNGPQQGATPAPTQPMQPGQAPQQPMPGQPMPQQQGTPQAAQFMSPAQAGMAKLLGLPDVTEVAKFYQTPQQRQPGSYYDDPRTGRREFIAKDGIQQNPDGTFGSQPGYQEAAARLAGLTAGATKAAEAPYTMVPTYRNGAQGVTPLSQVMGNPGSTGGTPMLTPQLQVSGDPASVRAQLLKIPDPKERDAMLAVFDRQFPAQAGGGFTQTGPSMADTAGQEYDKSRQTDFAARAKGIYDAGDAAPNVISRYSLMGQLLAGHDGGKFSPTGLEIASGLNSIGIKIDPKLGNKEAASALTAQLTKDAVGGSLGPGVSNSDVQIMQRMVPNLSQSAQGRATLIDMTVKTEKRKQEVAAAARKYEAKYGRLDNGFFSQLSQWADDHPLFGGQ